MLDIFGLIKNILLWGLLTIVFACIGFFTDNPTLMVPVYGAIFLCFIGIVFYTVSRNRVKTLEDKETHQFVFIAIAVIGLLLSILSPAYMISVFRPGLFYTYTTITHSNSSEPVTTFDMENTEEIPPMKQATEPEMEVNTGTLKIIVFTIFMLALGFASVYLINVLSLKNLIFTMAGFVLLVVTLLLPAIMVTGIDPSFGTMGVIYFITLVDAVFAWETFEMVKKILTHRK